MMPAPSNDDLDYLLSRGTLSGPRREQILQEALAAARARPARGRRWRWALGGGAGVAVAAAAAMVLLWPRVRPPVEGEFRAKGGGAGAPVIDMTCLGATVSACPRNSLVVFSIGSQEDGKEMSGALVSAYADPISPGERIWYLTNQPAVGPLAGKAVRIGDEHRPGRYRVEVVLSRRALGRADLVSARPPEVTARARFDLQVVP